MTAKELVALVADAAVRHDTSMAAAFRHALGIVAPAHFARRATAAAVACETSHEIRECFENRESPMDGRL